MSKNTNKKSYNQVIEKDVITEEKDFIETEETDKVIEEEEKVVKTSKSIKEDKSQKFKVYSVVSPKAVMAKGLEDNKWYSKINKGYHIGDIIE